jgi:hypothetical protein
VVSEGLRATSGTIIPNTLIKTVEIDKLITPIGYGLAMQAIFSMHTQFCCQFYPASFRVCIDSLAVVP